MDMVKSSWICIGLTLSILATAQGQKTGYVKDTITDYGIQLELGPLEASYAAEVFAVYQFDDIRDTLYPGNRPDYFKGDWPPGLKVTLFVRKHDSLAPQKLVVFDSFMCSTKWLLPSLEPPAPTILFRNDSDGNILLMTRVVNNLVELEKKPFLRIKYVTRTVYSLGPMGGGPRGRPLWADPFDPHDFVFKNPWIAPDR